MAMENIYVLKQLYANSMQPILLCDDKFNVVWKNEEALKLFPLEKKIPLQQLIIDDSIDYMDVLMQLLSNHNVRLSNDLCSLNFIPVNEQDTLQNILVEIHWNDDILQDPTYNEKKISLIVSQYRTCLANIFNQIPILALTLQENELYSDVRRLNNITKNCYNILKSTINISEYHKWKTHIAAHHPSPIIFNDFITDLCKSVDLMLRSTDCVFKYEICGEKIMTNVDVSSLNLAILNIISNACKYANVERTIKLTVLKQNESIVINVTDKGIGIPTENLEHIFKPYFTTNVCNSTSGGVGLGLTIAKQIIEKHGGSIIINSVYNYGTTVSIRIPIDDSILPTTIKSPVMATLTNKFSDFYIFLAEYANLTVL